MSSQRFYIEPNTNELIDSRIVLIYRCFSVIFIIFGTIFNLLSTIVYSKKHMRQTSFGVYLFTLAIVDLAVTWVGNLRFIFMFYQIGNNGNISKENFTILNGIDIRETSIPMCRLHRFLTYYLLQLSSAILCMLNIDRFIGCVLVLKSSGYCKTSVAKRLVILISVLILIINLHFLIDMGYYDLNNKLVCEPNHLNNSYIKFWSIYIWIDSILYAIVPFIIMIFCNIFIITRIVRSRVRSGSVIVHQKSFERSASIQKTTLRHHQRIGSSQMLSSMLPSERRLSIILIGISISFLLLTSPVSILETVLGNYLNLSIYSYTLAFSNMFMYLNHIINFFFYCSFGAKFRNEVKNLFPFKYLPNLNNKIVPTVITRSKTISESNNGLYKRYNTTKRPQFKKFASCPNSFDYHFRIRSYKPRVFHDYDRNPFVTTEVTIMANLDYVTYL